MKGQFNLLFEIDMKLELIQVDRNGAGFGIFRHFFHLPEFTENKGDFIRTGDGQKNLTVRTVSYRIICDR